jgi:hypothetical protein
VDIIQALTPQREPPFSPHAYTLVGDDFKRATWADIPGTGISEWHGVGASCLLIKRHVFEKIQQPWFLQLPDGGTEDLYFCRKALDAGFKVFVDSDNKSTHIANLEVKPSFEGGTWKIKFNSIGGVLTPPKL